MLTYTVLFRPHNNSCKNSINSILQMGKLRPKRGSWLPKVTLRAGQEWGDWDLKRCSVDSEAFLPGCEAASRGGAGWGWVIA